MKKGFKNTNSVTLRLFPGAGNNESSFEVVKVSGNPTTIDIDALIDPESTQVSDAQATGELETFDGYFPEDGYDYAQHLRDIDPERFVPAYKQPTDKRVDASDRELAEVLAALAGDVTGACDIDSEVVSKLGPLDERTRLGLLWGEDQVEDYISMPTERLMAIQAKIKEREMKADQADADKEFEAFFAREFDDNRIGGLTPGDVEFDEQEDLSDLDGEDSCSEAEREEEDPEEISRRCLVETKRLVAMNEYLQQSVMDRPDDLSDILIVPVSNVPDWDCQSVLSTRSNLFNHPGLILRPQREVRKPVAAAFIPEEEEVTVETPVKEICTFRKKGESPEERKERKKAVKEFQREQRDAKRSEKEERREQTNRQKNMIAVAKHNSYGDVPAGVPKFAL